MVSITIPPRLMRQGDATVVRVHGGMKEIFMPSIEETPGKGDESSRERGGRLVEEQRGKMLSRCGHR